MKIKEECIKKNCSLLITHSPEGLGNSTNQKKEGYTCESTEIQQLLPVIIVLIKIKELNVVSTTEGTFAALLFYHGTTSEEKRGYLCPV